MQEQVNSDNEEDPTAPIETLPPMSDIRQGYYAMLVTGSVSSFIKGLYRGEATFADTNTPLIGTDGNIRKEISFLYSYGLIRKLKIYSGDPNIIVQSYPLVPYAYFKSNLPEDSVSATYIIASNYQFRSKQGKLEIYDVSSSIVKGSLEGSFFTDRGDSINVSINFKAVKE